MNIIRENTGDLSATLRVEISESDYNEKVMKQLREYQRTASIPGFRKGQVPFGHINRLYGKAVRIDEIQKCIDESLQNYLKEEKLPIFGHPLSNNEKTGEVNFDTQKEFTFFFDIAYIPEINLDLSEISVDSFSILPDKKMQETYLDDIRERYGKFESPEVSEENDVVYGKIEELDEEGNLKQDGLNTFTSFKINTLVPDAIRESFIGKKKEEIIDFQFNEAFSKEADLATILRLPKEKAEQFASKVRFTLSGLSRVIPHEINEELYKKIFPEKEITTEEDFYSSLNQNLADIYKKEMDRKFLNDATKKLVDTLDITLPEEFLKRLFVQDDHSNTSIEQINNEWDEKYVPSLKWQIIEQKIRDEYQLELTTEEIRHFIKTQYLTKYMPDQPLDSEDKERQMEEMTESLMKNNEHFKYIYEQLYDEKLTALLNSKMKITEKKVSLEEYKELLAKAE